MVTRGENVVERKRGGKKVQRRGKVVFPSISANRAKIRKGGNDHVHPIKKGDQKRRDALLILSFDVGKSSALCKAKRGKGLHSPSSPFFLLHIKDGYEGGGRRPFLFYFYPLEKKGGGGKERKLNITFFSNLVYALKRKGKFRL